HVATLDWKTSSACVPSHYTTLFRSIPSLTVRSILLNIGVVTHVNYTLSLHDALPILPRRRGSRAPMQSVACARRQSAAACLWARSEEHTSELQSQSNIVCRLLLEKKKIRAWVA